MIARFFVDRPIFACVLSIAITLAGGIALVNLPLAQFPNISPPNVGVQCVYPGANAEDVAGAVAAPIEQQINGVEGMLYMSSSCTNDGQYSLNITFEHGTNLNVAQVLVQNRVALAIPSLPDAIKQRGVTVQKRSPDVLMGAALMSPSGQYDQLYLSNYAKTRIRDELMRLPGVADVRLSGQRDYAMRVWLNPETLAARDLTAGDVVQAIRDQNSEVAIGTIGAPPLNEDQVFARTLSALGRLETVEQFADIVLKASDDGRIVRLKDVARVELGSDNQDVSVRYNGHEAVFLVVTQMSSANALDVHEAVIDKMNELQRDFPEGIIWTINFDTTVYTSESIREVFKALRDAIVLVAIVVLVFLQNWRSAIIPLVTVPVAVVGTFAAMLAFDFSLNNLTLFGLVLAIGIVVDDAIVVVEAVEHHIAAGKSPREATLVAMRQVSGPVVAVGLVLSAVFVPCAFVSGITGKFFQQFALTIAVSTIISAFNSLTLSPALCALVLRPRGSKPTPPFPWLAFAVAGGWLGWVMLPELAADRLGIDSTSSAWTRGIMCAAGTVVGALVSWPVNQILRAAFRLFNYGFDAFTTLYLWIVGKLLYVTVLVLVVYGGLLAVTYDKFASTPKGFIPQQDMGYLLVTVQLPDSASVERTARVMRQIEAQASAIPGVHHVTAISGESFATGAAGSNFGSMFVGFDPYDERREQSRSSGAIVEKLKLGFELIPDAKVQVFPPPPMRGVGRAGGFTLMVEDRSALGSDTLQAQTEELVARATEHPSLTNLFSVFRANVPMLEVDPSPREVAMKRVNLRDFAETLTVFQGSLHVNDFNLLGRTWKVIVQAEHAFRDEVEDIARLKVRNAEGAMVPLGSLATVKQVNGPLVVNRYNMYPAASITGAAQPGTSSGDSLKVMEQLATATLPSTMAFEWTELAYLELKAGNTAMVIFGFAVAMVFLVLAAQYESWSLPLAVILVVPMCLLSAIIGVNLAGQDINIFTQIGFVVLVGLASKNAILIVEFAKHMRENGESRRHATLEACRLRLRPIIMTSCAFILGAAPLMIAHGAGAEMRQTLGTAVFSGMVGVTLFGIFLTPVFFTTIDWLGGTRMFASRLARRGAQLSLGLLTLRPIRRLREKLYKPSPPHYKPPARRERVTHE